MKNIEERKKERCEHNSTKKEKRKKEKKRKEKI